MRQRRARRDRLRPACRLLRRVLPSPQSRQISADNNSRLNVRSFAEKVSYLASATQQTGLRAMHLLRASSRLLPVSVQD